jgi:hypothetical protein
MPVYIITYLHKGKRSLSLGIDTRPAYRISVSACSPHMLARLQVHVRGQWTDGPWQRRASLRCGQRDRRRNRPP